MEMIALSAFIFAIVLCGYVAVGLGGLYLPVLFRVIAASLFGSVFVGTLAYGASVALSAFTSDPLPIAIAVASGAAILFSFALVRSIKPFIDGQTRMHWVDWVVVATAALFSAWLMQKSFRQGVGSTLLIASNTVFDFGHALSIVRSFSLGSNVPYMSPFVSGGMHLYHFLFWFLAGALERLGLPIILAVNVPSAITFFLFLLTVYLLPQVVFGKGRLSGIIAVALTVTNASLALWRLLGERGVAPYTVTGLWKFGKYPYAGPYDGSVISIFTTLNVFVNQRHLALGLAAALIAYMVTVHAARSGKDAMRATLIIGLVIALLPMWHMMMFVAAAALAVAAFTVYGKYREALAVAVLATFGGASWFTPFMAAFISRLGSGGPVQGGASAAAGVSFVGHARWIWENFGFSLVSVPLGLAVVGKAGRKAALPFAVLLACSLLLPKSIGQDAGQKFLNLFVAFANTLSAVGVAWLWKRGVFGKFAAAGLFVALTASGIISLMVVKNDFAYPVVDAPDNKLMAWIRTTPRDTVFLSYTDIFEPAVLSGRKTWFGFFRSPGQPERATAVRRVYEATSSADMAPASDGGVRYVIVPKWKKDDFPYTVDMGFLRSAYGVAFEDERHVVFAL